MVRNLKYLRIHLSAVFDLILLLAILGWLMPTCYIKILHQGKATKKKKRIWKRSNKLYHVSSSTQNLRTISESWVGEVERERRYSSRSSNSYKETALMKNHSLFLIFPKTITKQVVDILHIAETMNLLGQKWQPTTQFWVQVSSIITDN